jgi:hypothetical protein
MIYMDLFTIIYRRLTKSGDNISIAVLVTDVRVYCSKKLSIFLLNKSYDFSIFYMII